MVSDKNDVDKESVSIHKKVLAEIAYSAIKDIKGVSLIQDDFLGKVFRRLSQNPFSGISIRVNNNEVSLEVKVTIRYGLNIPLIAKEIQDVLKKAFSKTVEIDLKDINVNVQGVQRG